MGGRYEASGSQAEFQPGSDGRVLRNKLGITDPDEMDEVELVLLDQLYHKVLGPDFPERELAAEDLKDWHYQWLGNVYEWAGEERSVNLIKDDFHFAAAGQIPRLLKAFERDCLDRFTPCNSLSEQELVPAIAVTHVEFILVHPFREGNGRLARLLADVMAVQGGHNPLDYTAWDQDKASYFGAIQRGVSEEYGPMIGLVAKALEG